MNLQLVANIAIIVVLIGWIGYRQLTWRAVNPAQMIRLPLILAIIGVVEVAGTSKAATVHASDIGILAIELVLSLVLGSVMGLLAHFRPITEEAARAYQERGRRRDTVAPTLESRTGWLGLALWAVFIAIRVGIDVWAGQSGATIASSTGVILIMVAANRLARVGVIASRAARLSAVSA